MRGRDQMSQPNRDKFELPGECFSDQNFRKRKLNCLEQSENRESRKRKKVYREVAENSFFSIHGVQAKFKDVEVLIPKLKLSQQYLQSESSEPALQSEILQHYALSHEIATEVIPEEHTNNHDTSDWINDKDTSYSAPIECDSYAKQYEHHGDKSLKKFIERDLASIEAGDQDAKCEEKSREIDLTSDGSDECDTKSEGKSDERDLTTNAAGTGGYDKFDPGENVNFSLDAKKRKKKKTEHSIFCYHCQKTLTGSLGNLQRHVIYHYKTEILKGVSVGKTCNICSKICRDRSVLAEHCAKKHGRAKEVIPKEHFVFTRISKSKSTVKLSSDVEKLVEKLKWSGEVKQRSSGEYFSICHHCRTLNVGKRSSIQAHLATHYRTKIFEGFPEGNDCGLCKKRCSTRGELFIHYAISHEIAKKVIPKDHFECNKISDGLKGKVDKTKLFTKQGVNAARVDVGDENELCDEDEDSEPGDGEREMKLSSDVKKLTEKLAWSGEVKEMSSGSHFVFCHQCEILLVGCLVTLQRHMIAHYKNEILEGVSMGNECRICSKKCRDRVVLAEHCVKQHGMAKKVIPKEHYEFAKISEVLEGKLEMEQFDDARADSNDEIEFSDKEDDTVPDGNVIVDIDAAGKSNDFGTTSKKGGIEDVRSNPVKIASEQLAENLIRKNNLPLGKDVHLNENCLDIFERNELMEDYAENFPLKHLKAYFDSQPSSSCELSERKTEVQPSLK